MRKSNGASNAGFGPYMAETWRLEETPPSGPPARDVVTGLHAFKALQQVAQTLDLTENFNILTYAPRQHFFYALDMMNNVIFW